LANRTLFKQTFKTSALMASFVPDGVLSTLTSRNVLFGNCHVLLQRAKMVQLGAAKRLRPKKLPKRKRRRRLRRKLKRRRRSVVNVTFSDQPVQCVCSFLFTFYPPCRSSIFQT